MFMILSRMTSPRFMFRLVLCFGPGILLSTTGQSCAPTGGGDSGGTDPGNQGDVGNNSSAGADNVDGTSAGSWHTFPSLIGGPYPHVRAMTIFNDELVAAGRFSFDTGNGVAHNIASWNGSS